MESNYPHELHVSRNGEVRDRNALGYKGNGPILGRVRPSGEQKGWVVYQPDGTTLVGTFRTRHDALCALIEEYQEGRLP